MKKLVKKKMRKLKKKKYRRCIIKEKLGEKKYNNTERRKERIIEVIKLGKMKYIAKDREREEGKERRKCIAKKSVCVKEWRECIANEREGD